MLQTDRILSNRAVISYGCGIHFGKPRIATNSATEEPDNSMTNKADSTSSNPGNDAFERNDPSQSIPGEHAHAIRSLSHDLSNALEIIVQTSYLLGTTGLKDQAADWHRLLEQGIQKAVQHNQSLRDYIKSNSTF